MKNNSTIIGIIIIVLLIVVLGGLWWVNRPPAEGTYNEFASCLNDSGAVFYGAFWCPHCESQKELFGSAEKLLNYVECSTPDGRGQLAVCQEAEIQSYPTWEFADGSRLTGEVSLETLSEKTGCVLPVLNQ